MRAHTPDLLWSARCLLVAVALAPAMACDGGDDSSDQSVITDGDGGAPPAARPVLYRGFLPTLAPGTYWDIAHHYAGNFSGIGFGDRRAERITLGAPRMLDGHSAFPVEKTLLWSTQDTSDPWTFAYTDLAVDETRLWGRLDGQWSVLFDTHGTWTGRATFWIEDEGVLGVEPRALDTLFVDDPAALAAYRFTDAAQCIYYPEIEETICADGSGNQVSAASGAAYFSAGMGFSGHTQTNIAAGGSGTWQFAVIRHGPAAAPCGGRPLATDTCSNAARTCLQACGDFTCALACLQEDPNRACAECAELHLLACSPADPRAVPELQCCYDSLEDSWEGCPWPRQGNNAAACQRIGTLAPCVGLASVPMTCAGEFPRACERREVNDCFTADTVCNTVVDCAGAGGLGLVGCNEPTSAVDCEAQTCLPVQSTEASDARCRDGQDNDDNGFTDCDDFSCKANPLITVCGNTEVTNPLCSDGLDNDGNGFRDCDDFACLLSPSVSVCGTEHTPSACANERDDDNDGRTDCADGGCSVNPFVVCD